ncbi:hypothetical protein [Paraburkholderia fungorum]|uniref:hypothetical protein n=1 Tax=Paraburkholderia fungorum TaxID=134537 RepID=UPI00162049C4|nr:hypothetical protein [Paraburkholderia fungorum]MBB5547477.1 hypothetical protein [Paraburkholderia fungorum]
MKKFYSDRNLIIAAMAVFGLATLWFLRVHHVEPSTFFGMCFIAGAYWLIQLKEAKLSTREHQYRSDKRK